MNAIDNIRNSDTRRFSRIPFEAAAQIYFPPSREYHAAFSLDISLKGAMLETLQPLDDFQEKGCCMLLVLGKCGEEITMEGRVVHQQDKLVGIECQAIDRDSMDHLRHFLESNIEDPACLEKEMAEAGYCC